MGLDLVTTSHLRSRSPRYHRAHARALLRCKAPTPEYPRFPSLMTKPIRLMNVDDLIARARAGDTAALEQLFQHYARPIGTWATYALVKNAPGGVRPSDIAQEASLRAFRKFSSFRGNTGGELDAWLKAIVARCSTQWRRDARRQKRDPRREVRLDEQHQETLLDLQTSPSRSAADKESWHQVLVAISELPPEQQKAISLCLLRRTRYADAAKRMGTTEAAVTALVQRGIRTLAERFRADTNSLPALKVAEEAMDPFLDYLQRKDAAETIDVEAFLVQHSSCATSLRLLIEWATRIKSLELSTPDEGEE